MNRLILSVSLALTVFSFRPAFAADKPVCSGDKPVEVATCNSGKVMCAKTNEHRGACAGEGGVKTWSDGSPVKSHARKTEYK